MPNAIDILPDARRSEVRPPRFERFPQAVGRRVVVLAVHHVESGGMNLTGGAEKYAQTVIRALLDAGAGVHVGYSGSSIYTDLLDEYDPRRLTVEQTGWLNEDLAGDARFHLRTVQHRRRWLQATAADTVFAVQQAGGAAFAASLLAAKRLGLRVVASLRQPPQPLPESPGKHWLRFIPSPEIWRRRLVWRRRVQGACCDALIYNSRRVAAAYASQFGWSRRKAVVIYNGERSTEWSGRPPRDRPFRLAAVGRIAKEKGADLAMEAFAVVARSHPECRLTYYGEGPARPILAQRARDLGIAHRVDFAGYIRDRDRIFTDIDICIHLSRREAMSNSVVEAMSRGIPCVVSDVGGLPEVVSNGQTGYVVRRGDAAAGAKAVCKLLRDRQTYFRFSHASGRRATCLFDLHDLMRETVQTILGID